MFLDVVVAAGLFALCLGIGWLVHRTKEFKPAVRTDDRPDPVHELRQLDRESLAELKTAAALLESARRTIESGVR